MKMTKTNHNFKGQTQEIIEQCKAGEQKAQFQLFKYYYHSMYKTSLDIVQDKSKAEDIIQQAFMSAFEKIDTFEKQENFDNWLENIVVHTSAQVKNSGKSSKNPPDKTDKPSRNKKRRKLLKFF